MYIFDTSPLIIIFRHFYKERFPSLWEKFDEIKSRGKIISVREVENEIKTYGETDRLAEWAARNRDFFHPPTREELLIVSEIFQVTHFQNLIRRKERLQGKPVADPFVAAKAKIIEGFVVTEERNKKNSAQLPNVCEYLQVPCINLEEFMKREEWTF